MASSTTPPPASAGPALFHAAITRHKAGISGSPLSRPLRVVNGDSPVASSSGQTSTDQNTPPSDNNAASPSTASTTNSRDSLFSGPDEEESHCSGEDPSVYHTARSSSSSLTVEVEDFPPFHSVRRYTSRRNSNASSEEFPTRSNLTPRNPKRPRLTVEEFSTGINPDRRDSNLIYHASNEDRRRAPSPDRASDSDLGSDSTSAVGASLATNRRIFAEGFSRMEAQQAALEHLVQTIVAGQRSDFARLARGRFTTVEAHGRRVRAATEEEGMALLVEAVPFSADGRGHCDEAEVRRVALRGKGWGLMSDSPYPRMDGYHE
jgi:hypothetical protein